MISVHTIDAGSGLASARTSVVLKSEKLQSIRKVTTRKGPHKCAKRKEMQSDRKVEIRRQELETGGGCLKASGVSNAL